MAMLDGEFRFGTCTMLVLLTWGTALGLLTLSCLADMHSLAEWGVSTSGLGAALLVIRDNAKTRRVVRAVSRETPAPVRSLRD